MKKLLSKAGLLTTLALAGCNSYNDPLSLLLNEKKPPMREVKGTVVEGYWIHGSDCTPNCNYSFVFRSDVDSSLYRAMLSNYGMNCDDITYLSNKLKEGTKVIVKGRYLTKNDMLNLTDIAEDRKPPEIIFK